jgi:hypothetical protein
MIMTSALVQNNTVTAFYAGSVPSTIALTNGHAVIGASDALIGTTFSDGSQILPASYTDTPPSAKSYSTGNNYTISNGSVQVTRNWVTPSAVPPSVTKAQACVALYLTPSPANTGKTLLDDVTAAVAAAGGAIPIWWANAQVINRNSAFVSTLSAVLNLSSAQLDTLFTLAAQQEG